MRGVVIFFVFTLSLIVLAEKNRSLLSQIRMEYVRINCPSLSQGTLGQTHHLVTFQAIPLQRLSFPCGLCSPAPSWHRVELFSAHLVLSTVICSSTLIWSPPSFGNNIIFPFLSSIKRFSRFTRPPPSTIPFWPFSATLAPPLSLIQ